MRAIKVIFAMLLIMAAFAFVLVPAENGVFPSWINTDFVQFIVAIFCAVCALLAMR